MVREQLDATARAMDESAEGVRNLLGDTSVGLHRRLEDLAGRPRWTRPSRWPRSPQRLEALAGRLDAMDEGMSGRLGTLGGSLEDRLTRLESEVGDRPDRGTVTALVERAHAASEQRNAGQLDEAMATFAELILGRGASVQQPPPPPRPTQRRTPRPKVKSSNGASAAHTELVTDDPDD